MFPTSTRPRDVRLLDATLKREEAVAAEKGGLSSDEYLELVNRTYPLNECSVMKLLEVATENNAVMAVRRSEHFLLHHSRRSLGEKIIVANTFNLEKLKDVCVKKSSMIEEISFDDDDEDLEPAPALPAPSKEEPPALPELPQATQPVQAVQTVLQPVQPAAQPQFLPLAHLGHDEPGAFHMAQQRFLIDPTIKLSRLAYGVDQFVQEVYEDPNQVLPFPYEVDTVNQLLKMFQEVEEARQREAQEVYIESGDYHKVYLGRRGEPDCEAKIAKYLELARDTDSVPRYFAPTVFIHDYEPVPGGVVSD